MIMRLPVQTAVSPGAAPGTCPWTPLSHVLSWLHPDEIEADSSPGTGRMPAPVVAVVTRSALKRPFSALHQASHVISELPSVTASRLDPIFALGPSASPRASWCRLESAANRSLT